MAKANIDAFKARMIEQRAIELLAMDTYLRFTEELKHSELRGMFQTIAVQEEQHAKAIDEILELLQ